MAETASTGGGELGTRGGAGADRLRPQRYDTVRAALRYRADGAKKRKIRERIVRTEAGRRAFDISPWEAAERLKCPIDHPEPDGPSGGAAGHGTGEYRWRLEADRPEGGGQLLASDGWTKSTLHLSDRSTWGIWTIGWGGSREDEPRWFDLANDTLEFYVLLTDEICGISPSCAPWPSRCRDGGVVGREALRLRGVPGSGGWGMGSRPLDWAPTSTRRWWTRSAACCCAASRWGEETSTLGGRGDPFDEDFPEGTFTSREPLPWS